MPITSRRSVRCCCCVQAGALFLLLIGAVNLVNLLLIRASARRKELAVRQAIGASRRHVVAEVLVETTLLTLAGGLLGLVVGAAGIRLLGVARRRAPPSGRADRLRRARGRRSRSPARRSWAS